MVWGASVIVDSPVFSTALSEVADPCYTGTALTTQTAIGFLLTLVTINIVQVMAALVGWQYAFVVLAPDRSWVLLLCEDIAAESKRIQNIDAGSRMPTEVECDGPKTRPDSILGGRLCAPLAIVRTPTCLVCSLNRSLFVA